MFISKKKKKEVFNVTLEFLKGMTSALFKWMELLGDYNTVGKFCWFLAIDRYNET